MIFKAGGVEPTSKRRKRRAPPVRCGSAFSFALRGCRILLPNHDSELDDPGYSRFHPARLSPRYGLLRNWDAKDEQMFSDRLNNSRRCDSYFRRNFKSSLQALYRGESFVLGSRMNPAER